MSAGQRLELALRLPELNVIGFAVLLNFPWEFLQAPLFEGMRNAPHWAAVQRCSIATLGDGVIMLVGFWTVAAIWKTRRWVLTPTLRQVGIFTSVGLVITIIVERLATAGLWPMPWAYAATMPVVPLIGAGLFPLLQWIVLPPLALWLVRRQIR